MVLGAGGQLGSELMSLLRTHGYEVPETDGDPDSLNLICKPSSSVAET